MVPLTLLTMNDDASNASRNVNKPFNFCFSEMDEQKAEHAGIREQEAEDAIRLSETPSPSTTFTMRAPEQVSQGRQRGW